MAIRPFLAMTGAEIKEKSEISSNTAWMACHFSAYGTGLSNLPPRLPRGAMLILNDRTPVCGHDPALIAGQLSRLVEETGCAAVLLDFQRPDVAETAAITDAVIDQCSCPVGVTEYYARERSCPVFLPPVPPHVPLAEYFSPWQSREIWLELALDGVEITVTPEGSQTTPLPSPEPAPVCHREPQLHCHYDITLEPERIRFQLYRTPEDLNALLTATEELGVTKAVGLYQELRDIQLDPEK